VSARGWPKLLWEPTEMSATRGRSTASSSARPVSEEPWWATLSTSTGRSDDSRLRLLFDTGVVIEPGPPLSVSVVRKARSAGPG
jgi:hypothetical protein